MYVEQTPKSIGCIFQRQKDNISQWPLRFKTTMDTMEIFDNTNDKQSDNANELLPL